MGISCTCFSRYEADSDFRSDDSPRNSWEVQRKRARESADRRPSTQLDTIAETSERASSNDRKKSDEMRLSQENRRSGERRRSNERRLSADSRPSSEQRRSHERRISQELANFDQGSSESEIDLDALKEEDRHVVREIFKAHKIETPDQIARFLSLMRAKPGHTPIVRSSSEKVPQWIKTLTPPEKGKLTGENISP